MDYLDFEIEIGTGSGRDYPVSVRTPEGDARRTMRFPFDELALDNRLKDLQIALLRSGGKRRKMLSAEEQAVQDFGRDLFNALLADDVRTRYDLMRRRAQTEGRGLRVKLRILSPELAALPWEFLYDSRQNEYVCLSRHTPLVRTLELTQPGQPLTVRPPLRVLGLIASPNDLPKLDVAREKGRIETALKDLLVDRLVELHWLAGQTWRDLQRAMRGGPWHVFHFIGHGKFDRNADEGVVALADDYGDTYHLRASQLALLLADHPTLRFALLNACEGAQGGGRDIFSSTASILIGRGLPAALAMQYEITDRAAIEFARSFYEALADGLPVDAAVGEARKSIRLAVANTVEWGTPVLYMRSPDGVLFDLQPSLAVREAEQRAEAERLAKQKAEEERAARQKAETERLAKEKAEAERKAKAEAEPATPRAQSPILQSFDFAQDKSPVSDLLTLTHPFPLDLIRIPAGEFLMGSDPTRDKDAQPNEQPQHRVYVSEFYIGKYPITNAQYAVFKKIQIPSGKENHPVVNVLWHDAVTFCQWLSKETGQTFRLPTEAEWEKAARGVDGRLYPWENEWDPKKLNSSEGGVGSTTPVDKYSPAGDSPYGAADMAGNVWEWCADWYADDLYAQRVGQEMHDPSGPSSGSARVVRGGSWYNDRWSCRAATRGGLVPAGFLDSLGFRVARSPVLRS
jgi:formylglycine-generating enzyme required for sulfatase activity